MIKIRRSEERGHSELGWLNAYQTFSFGNYQNPDYMGFRALRVLKWWEGGSRSDSGRLKSGGAG